jgi:hypothetical protein
MKMYVANVTRHDHTFTYRIPGSNKIFMQSIPQGGQIVLSGDLTSDDIASVEAQHQIYGLIPAVDVDRTTKHINCMFSVNKPVSVEQMRKALERNLKVMTDLGHEQRKAAAVGISEKMREDDPETYNHVDIEVREIDPHGHSAPKIVENMRVVREANEDPITTPPRKRGRPPGKRAA